MYTAYMYTHTHTHVRATAAEIATSAFAAHIGGARGPAFYMLCLVIVITDRLHEQSLSYSAKMRNVHRSPLLGHLS